MAGRAVGFGGIFIRSSDPERLQQWYVEHFGLPADEAGAHFDCRDDGGHGRTVFAVFEADSDYFGSREQATMVNFRVDDLDAILDRLKAAGVEILPDRQSYDFGKFAWVVDPDGNRVELWEPV